jgi:cytochrome c553
MLSTVLIVAEGLSTGHKIGLAVVGGAFIVFAIVSSFLLPRWNENFPGRSMGLYLTICVLFFAAMIAAVIVFGRESEASAERTQAVTTTRTPTKPPQGKASAGKAVFASAGCETCHTLRAAGATGKVGPNLDQLKPAYARIVTQVENGGQIMPPFKDKLTATQIHDVAAYVFVSTH